MDAALATVERLELRANWSARPVSLHGFASDVVELVRKLRLVSPSLRDWVVLTNVEPWFAAWDAEAATLLPLLIDTNFSESKRDRDAAQAHPDTLRNAGSFRVHLACTSAGGGPTDAPEQGGLTLDINCGATPLAAAGKKLWTPQSWVESERVRTRSRAEVSLRLPANHFGALHEPGVLQAMLGAVVGTWKPSRCTVTSFEFLKRAYGMEAFGREQRATGGQRKLWQGWLTYLRLPTLTGFLSGSGLDVEAGERDGCLLFTDRSRIDSAQVRQVEAAQAIDRALAGFCINQDEVLVDGWPYDTAEHRYARQCGAAPSGTGKRVGLADFTLLSRERLIFSRLFRSEALGDLLYSPDSFDQAIDSMRPVAEAHKQLRSLELVGASTPIEWHIGREELVEPLRTLLHQHAGIDEARLRVVSTPYIEKS